MAKNKSKIKNSKKAGQLTFIHYHKGPPCRGYCQISPNTSKYRQIPPNIAKYRPVNKYRQISPNIDLSIFVDIYGGGNLHMVLSKETEKNIMIYHDLSRPFSIVPSIKYVFSHSPTHVHTTVIYPCGIYIGCMIVCCTFSNTTECIVFVYFICN